jgi:hypothetical protein
MLLHVRAPGLVLDCWYSPSRGYCPHVLRRLDRATSVRATIFPPVLETRMRKPIPQASEKTGPLHLAPVESKVFGKLMNIIAHCAEVRYDDGTPRQPGWVTVRTLGGSWQVTAKEPEAGCQLVSVAATLDDALAQLNLLLGAPEAPWEVDPWARRQGGGNQKKKG